MSTVSALIDQSFAYAAGRTGVLQQLLMTASDRDRLLGSSNLAEAEAILTELKLTNPIDQGLKKADEILPAIGLWIRTEVEQMSPASKWPTFSILWIQEDAPLIAYLLKKHHGLTSNIAQQPVASMSAYDPEALIDLIEHDNAGALPMQLVQCVETIKAMSDPDPIAIDAAVAQFAADLKIRLARASGSTIIKKYVSHAIDVQNIRTALRGGSDSLLEGGSIDPSKLKGERDQILKAIDASPLPYSLSDDLRKAGDNINAMEMAFSEVIASDIAHMWNIPMSIEPVFAFAALAKMQLQLIRVLVIGKRAGMSPQEIKHMLPPFLSASHYVL